MPSLFKEDSSLRRSSRTRKPTVPFHSPASPTSFSDPGTRRGARRRLPYSSLPNAEEDDGENQVENRSDHDTSDSELEHTAPRRSPRLGGKEPQGSPVSGLVAGQQNLSDTSLDSGGGLAGQEQQGSPVTGRQTPPLSVEVSDSEIVTSVENKSLHESSTDSDLDWSQNTKNRLHILFNGSPPKSQTHEISHEEGEKREEREE